MHTKLILTCSLFLFAQRALFAQAFNSMHHTQIEAEVDGAVNRLQQYALLALIVAVVLMGIVWIAYLYKSCKQLTAPKRSAQVNLFLFLFGLIVLGSSCTGVQLARAVEIETAQTSENPCYNSPHRHRYDAAYINYSTASTPYSNWRTPVFCKFCGKRIYPEMH